MMNVGGRYNFLYINTLNLSFMKENVLKTKSFEFALNSISMYKELTNNKEFILSKQFLRSATSVGANVREANNSQSSADFIHKLYISLKECDEAQYWLELLFASNYINKNNFEDMINTSEEIKRILKSSILTSKSRLKTKS